MTAPNYMSKQQMRILLSLHPPQHIFVLCLLDISHSYWDEIDYQSSFNWHLLLAKKILNTFFLKCICHLCFLIQELPHSSSVHLLIERSFSGERQHFIFIVIAYLLCVCCVQMPMEARNCCSILLYPSSPYLLRQDFSLILELLNTSWQHTQRSACSGLHRHAVLHPVLSWVLRIQKQALRLVWQPLYQLFLARPHIVLCIQPLNLFEKQQRRLFPILQAPILRLHAGDYFLCYEESFYFYVI